MAAVLFALLHAQLVAVPAPNGGAIDADSAFRRALEALASLDDDSRALVQAFADGAANRGRATIWG